MSMTRDRGALFCLSIALACSFGVRAAAEEAGLSHEQLVKTGLKASEKEMGWWRDAKFGIIIHWGVGIEKRHAPWANKTDDAGEADKAYWDKLSKNLAEVDKFDAAEWMQVVKESGARYVVFATRHNGLMQRRAERRGHDDETEAPAQPGCAAARSSPELCHGSGPFRDRLRTAQWLV